MGSHSVTCHPTEVILTPLPPAYCRYSFIDPERMKGWVGSITYPLACRHV